MLTGEPFDTEQQDKSSLDLSSLFSVDTDALKDAFQFDASKLQFDLSGAFNLTTLRPSSIRPPSSWI